MLVPTINGATTAKLCTWARKADLASLGFLSAPLEHYAHLPFVA